MKLTKKIKADFVEAVLADVPRSNYPTKVEDLLRKNYFALRKKLKLDGIVDWRLSLKRLCVAYYEHLGTEEISAHQDTSVNSWEYKYHVIAVITAHGLSNAEVDSLENAPEISELVQKYIDELTLINTLRKKLEATIAACTTLKQAKECLPEFEKYLPAEAAPADRSLPVVGNLVADLIKVGWPKKK